MAYGTGANVVLEARAGVDDLVAVRASATTHSLDTEQRRLPLEQAPLPSYPAQRVEAPTLPGTAPPGPYMAFAVDDVASQARRLELGQGALELPVYPADSELIQRSEPGPGADQVDAWAADGDHHARHHEVPEQG